MFKLMARLNDPPLPGAESLDILKRRFIRQNRELARVNSSQSQRIRNIETEISRLLAENIALREQAIRANEEAERLRSSNQLTRDVLALKERLQMKINEANVLVEELGGLPDKATARTGIKRRSKSGAPHGIIKSPNEREWRNQHTMNGILNSEQEGRLPAILEDKHYPRRTMEAAELKTLTMRDDPNIESPEIGPPPVVHFEVNEAIAFDYSRSPAKIPDETILDDGSITLPSNFETRRRRRTSSLLQELPVLDSGEADSAKKGQEQQRVVKPVVKRKVDIYELDESQPATMQDDFVFQRKSSTTTSDRPRPSRFTARSTRENERTTTADKASPQKAAQVSRQALAPKTSNSPVKRPATSVLEKRNTPRDRENSEKASQKAGPVARPKARLPVTIDIPSNIGLDLVSETKQPKTPAAELGELMSPASGLTEPPTTSRSSAMSEMAITNSVEDVLNGSIGRGSRRARAAVSYAEPNLRDKMRRPDKKLVGAVEGLSKPSANEKDPNKPSFEEPNGSDEDRQDLGEVNAAGTDAYEIEEAPKPTWTASSLVHTIESKKEEAASPLRDKERKYATERRHKRTFSEVERPTTFKSSLKPAGESVIGRSIEQLSIFDPPTSSPVAGDRETPEFYKSRARQGTASSSAAAVATTTARTMSAPVSMSTTTGLKTRRHSMQVQPKSTLGGPIPRPNSAMSSREAAAASKEPSSARLKRPSSVQAIHQTPSTKPDDITSERSSSAAAAAGGAENLESGVGRTMSTRRRSMMV